MTERDRFEDAWREKYPLHESTIFKRSGLNPDAYVNTRVQDGWLMWQACSTARSAGAKEPVAEIVRWLDFTNKPRFDIKVIDKTLEHGAKLYSQPMPQTDAARERPSVVLAYSTKGHNKPCGQTMGANGCGEFVTVYYGDIDAAERSARDRICNLEKAGHRFNWAIVMRADEEAYRGPAMTFEEIERLDRAKGE